MHKIAILLKTYLGDIKYVERLIDSYRIHNSDNIPLYIVAPGSDLLEFQKFTGNNIELFSDESITSNLVHDNSVMGIRPGYINQEIIKLAFWEKKLCKNYFCMDSDGVFIRDFFITDFMYDDETPYTILVEDNELKVEPEYYNTYWIGREKLIRKIQEEVGLVDERILTCHAFAIFSCKVLESFYYKYLIPLNRTYIDLMKIAPYEFSWYNMWLQKDKTIGIEIKEPIIKFFHQKSHHIEYVRKGITTKDIARGFIGYNINSNYSRHEGIIEFEDVANYELSIREIKTYSFSIVWSLIKKINRKFINKIFRRIERC